MPSDDDKAVARIADKYALFMANEIGEPMGGLYDENSLAAIREAIQETRKQTLEGVAVFVEELASGAFCCDYVDGSVARQTLKSLAPRIRALAVDSKDAAEGTEAR